MQAEKLRTACLLFMGSLLAMDYPRNVINFEHTRKFLFQDKNYMRIFLKPSAFSCV